MRTAFICDYLTSPALRREMLALHLLQSALVHVNTILVQRVPSEPERADCLSDDDRRGLTPLF